MDNCCQDYVGMCQLLRLRVNVTTSGFIRTRTIAAGMVSLSLHQRLFYLNDI